MKLIRRCTLRGAVKYILPITLLILMFVGFMWLLDINQELRKTNGVLVNTIKDLETEIVDLNSEITKLKEDNEQLQKDSESLKNTNEELQEENDILMQQASSSGVFKSYTDYQCLSKNSAQWNIQKQAYTDENGLRKIGDAYLVALGSYYGTTLGARYEVTLSNGNTFQIILCDCKKDIHTDAKNKATISDGSILEFYVDASSLPRSVKRSGTISSIDFFSSGVASIVPI